MRKFLSASAVLIASFAMSLPMLLATPAAAGQHCDLLPDSATVDNLSTLISIGLLDPSGGSTNYYGAIYAVDLKLEKVVNGQVVQFWAFNGTTWTTPHWFTSNWTDYGNFPVTTYTGGGWLTHKYVTFTSVPNGVYTLHSVVYFYDTYYDVYLELDAYADITVQHQVGGGGGGP